jgi:hypothetical protein
MPVSSYSGIVMASHGKGEAKIRSGFYPFEHEHAIEGVVHWQQRVGVHFSKLSTDTVLGVRVRESMNIAISTLVNGRYVDLLVAEDK